MWKLCRACVRRATNAFARNEGSCTFPNWPITVQWKCVSDRRRGGCLWVTLALLDSNSLSNSQSPDEIPPLAQCATG